MGEEYGNKDELGITYAEMQSILKRARQTYGNLNQLMVCIEELNELACVLAKFPRYEDDAKATHELYDKALDEVADVYTILEHIKAIFNMSEEDVWRRRGAKAARLDRWLTHSNSMTETLIDREVRAEKEHMTAVPVNSRCKGCKVEWNQENYDAKCVHCLKAQATEGIAPYWEG